MTAPSIEVPNLVEELPEPPMIIPIQDRFQSSYHFDELTPRGTPERGLLMAVLEMSVRDLSQRAHHLDRKAAISWFTARPPKRSPEGFTFEDIADYLDLGFNELKSIHLRVELAKQYEFERVKSVSDLIKLEQTEKETRRFRDIETLNYKFKKCTTLELTQGKKVPSLFLTATEKSKLSKKCLSLKRQRAAKKKSIMTPIN